MMDVCFEGVEENMFSPENQNENRKKESILSKHIIFFRFRLGCILILGGWFHLQELRKLIVQILLQLFHMISTNHSISGTFLVEPWDPSRRSRIAFLQETWFQLV